MALIELATEFRVLAKHLERDAGWTAATTVMGCFIANEGEASTGEISANGAGLGRR
jgi:hypothetical protein